MKCDNYSSTNVRLLHTITQQIAETCKPAATVWSVHCLRALYQLQVLFILERYMRITVWG